MKTSRYTEAQIIALLGDYLKAWGNHAAIFC